VRCVQCGGLLSAPPIPYATPTYYACPQCGAPVPVLPLRDPPPLYAWEVYPNLYPPAPIPRGHPERCPRSIAALLWAATILLAGAAVTFGAVGALTVGAAPVTVGGIVEIVTPSGSLAPLAGAVVHLAGESGQERTEVTDAQGAFRFDPVADGGISVNVSYGNLGPAEVELFASPFYSTTGLSDLRIVLDPANASASTSAVDTDFADQESYLTSVGSAAVLLGLGAGASGLAAHAASRRRIGAAVAAGGASAAVTPTAFYLLGLLPAFPSLAVPSVLAILFGGVAAGLAGAWRWFFGPFEGDPPTPELPARSFTPGPRAGGRGPR
jgi:hypothetical protein